MGKQVSEQVLERRKRSEKSGLPPGTLMHIGKKHVTQPRITVLDYSEDRIDERRVERVKDCFQYRDTDTISWINVDGVHDTDVIREIGEHFGLHPLLLEDLVNTEQRPKFEEYQDHAFFVLKMLEEHEDGSFAVEQVSIILGKTYVLTFQERIGDVFDNIRDRLRGGKRIRSRGADYLAYALTDTIVDRYFVVLERFGERVEKLEEAILREPENHPLSKIQRLKRETIVLRKAIVPLRDVINQLERAEPERFQQETLLYFRDVYDHAVQVTDTLQTYRELISGLLDIQISMQSNRMNEVMKVLTIIATIFIPLTFITGVYGMNFHYMPEIPWRYGYFVTLTGMLVIAVLMLVFFRRKGWM